MSILILDEKQIHAARLGATLDQHGIHDWRIGTSGPALCRLVCGPSDDPSALPDAHLQPMESVLAYLAGHPTPPLLEGTPLALKQAMHGVHNALTPALISAGMTQASLRSKAPNRADLCADFEMLSEALEVLKSRLESVGELTHPAPIALDPYALLGFCDRPDSPILNASAKHIAFDLQPAPSTRLAPSTLSSWLETAAAVPTHLTVQFRLRAQDEHACLRIASEAFQPSWFAIARAAQAAGATVQWHPNGLELRLPRVTPRRLLTGTQALLLCQASSTAQRFADALCQAGYLVTRSQEPEHSAQYAARFGAIFMDLSMRAAWPGPLPLHALIFDRHDPPNALGRFALTDLAAPETICAMADELTATRMD